MTPGVYPDLTLVRKSAGLWLECSCGFRREGNTIDDLIAQMSAHDEAHRA